MVKLTTAAGLVGSVTAATDAEVGTAGTASGNVTATGGNAKILVLVGSVTGEVKAGKDAEVTAGQNLVGPVTAGTTGTGNATVRVLGDVQG